MNDGKRVTSISVLVALIWLVSGCASTPQSPAVVGFDTYLEVQPTADSDSVIAILSYSAAGVSRSRMYEPQEFQLFFSNQHHAIVTSGVIHINYPIAANDEELDVYVNFTGAWIDDVQDLRGSSARRDYVAATSELILNIADHEYESPEDR